MKKRLLEIKSAVFLFTALLFIFHCQTARGDARTDYLVKLLKSSGSYRVKVQAAQTLGRIKAKEAVPSLVGALEDKSDTVVLAAAAALEEIGDASAITGLERARKKAPSSAVGKQLERTIEKLKKKERGQPEVAAEGGKKLSYLVKVDEMANSSSSKRGDIAEVLRKIVVESLSSSGEVALQPEGLSLGEVEKRLKSENLKGFILSGSLVKLEQKENYLVVNITLNVFTSPGYNLVMMPSGEIRVPAGSPKASEETLKSVQNRAMRRLVGNLVSKILEAAPNVL